MANVTGEVQVAFERAAELMAEAAKSLPAVEVAARIRALLNNDGYAARARFEYLDIAGG